MSSNNEEGVVHPDLEKEARAERDFLRDRLHRELGHEPTEEELDEWLRQHTEGY